MRLLVSDTSSYYYKNQHNSEYHCLLCDYKTSSRYRVEDHVKGVHHSVKHLPCPLCTQTFNTPNNRQIHVKRQHGVKMRAKEIEEMVKAKQELLMQQ